MTHLVTVSLLSFLAIVSSAAGREGFGFRIWFFTGPEWNGRIPENFGQILNEMQELNLNIAMKF
jgi:hypothetical protein